MEELTVVTTVPPPPSPSSPRIQAVIRLAVGSLPSPHTRRVYGRLIERYLAWLGPRQVSEATLREYFVSAGVTPHQQHCTITAVRHLTRAALTMGEQIDEETVNGIMRVRPVEKPIKGRGVGTWLSQKQLLAWLNRVNGRREENPLWVRNGALIALLCGCGLRRDEAAGVRESDLRKVEGRWIVELVGKGRKRRAIAIPDWAWAWIEDWVRCLPGKRIDRVREKQYLLRRVWGLGWPGRPDDDGGVSGAAVDTGRISGEAIRLALKWVLEQEPIDGVEELRPHDLRRTYAILGLRNGAALDMIRNALGHSSIQTTERYLQGADELRPGMGVGDLVLKGHMLQGDWMERVMRRQGVGMDREAAKWVQVVKWVGEDTSS